MTSLDLDDTLVSYINGRSLGGACCGFLFEGPLAFIWGRPFARRVLRHDCAAILVFDVAGYACERLQQLARRCGFDVVHVPAARLLVSTGDYVGTFFEIYKRHIAAATSGSHRSTAFLSFADKVRRTAERYAAVVGEDFSTVAHMFTPRYALRVMDAEAACGARRYDFMRSTP